MDAPIHAMMREPATVDERAPLLRGPGSGFNRRGASIRGCLDGVSRVASNRWFRAAMVAKSAFFTLGTVILLHHGSSMSTGRTRREGNGYLEVPAEAHFAPLWSGDPLRHHPAADDLNIAWFPVHRGRFVMDQTAERAKDAGGNRAKDDRMPKWPKHVIGGDDWADLGVVAMSGAFGGAREKQPEFWFHAVPGDIPVVSMDVRGHGESERGWNSLGVDDAFDALRWNLMANDVLAVADDAKFRRVVLVGSSMTNAVALWAAVSPHVKDRVAGVLLVRPATGWEIRGEGICKLRKIAWTHASFAMLLRRSRRFAEGVDSDELDSANLAPLPPPELTSSLVGESERAREGDAKGRSNAKGGFNSKGESDSGGSGWVSRWVLKGSAWKGSGRPGSGNPRLGNAGAKVEPRDEVYESIEELDPGLDGYWSKIVEKYLGSGTVTDGARYLAAAKRYAESEPEEWRRISPLVPLRYLGDKVSDYPSRRALQLWFASPAGNETPVKVIAYNWSRTHRYVMAKALRFLTKGDWARDYLADGHDGLARDIAEFVEKVRRREESVASGGGGDGESDKSRTKVGMSDDFWREDEEDEERIAGVTRDEDWVRSDYVDGNEDDDDSDPSSALGRRRARRTRAMHGLMKEIDALLGAEDADDMEAEIDFVPGDVLEEEATRLVRADAERVTARGRSLDDWLVENFGRDVSLKSLDLLDYCDGRCCRLKTQLPESGWVPEKARSGPGVRWVFHEELASEEAKCYAGEAEDAAREERRVRAGGRLTKEERMDVDAEKFCVAVIKARLEETKSAAEESRATLAASVGDVEKSSRRRRHRGD